MTEEKTTVLHVMDGGAPDRDMTKLFKGTFLDMDGDNFMGSGLSFREWSALADVLRYNRWYGTQVRDERKRRTKYLIQLCAEQERLVTESIQATGLSEILIEHVIEGDWIGVLSWIEGLRFEIEKNERGRAEAKRFARFRKIAQEAYDTRPTVFCPVCSRPAPEEHIAAFHDGRHVCPWCKVVHDDEGNWVEKAKANLSPVETSDD